MNDKGLLKFWDEAVAHYRKEERTMKWLAIAKDMQLVLNRYGLVWPAYLEEGCSD